MIPFAPLHNPGNLQGIEVALGMCPGVPQVAVFDTAFHQTLPPHAFTYAVPEVWRTEHGVRRYGFHGTSVEYVAGQAAEMLGRDAGDCNLIVLHLGNGASATAVDGGRSIDTSMGLTPLEGLVMGTRSGDVDPAVVAHLIRVAGLSAEDIDDQLNRHSGLSALAGANDMREVHRRAESGEPGALLALDVYCYRVRKYVGAYHAVLGRLDAVVFTAGVGENDPDVRARALASLEPMGIEVDPARNRSPGRDARSISPDNAAVAVLVVPTNEELEIARQTLAVTTRPTKTAFHP
jgi:acetate kinase